MLLKVTEHFICRMEFKFHGVTVSHLSDSFEHNPVVHIETIFDQVNIILFTLNRDFTLPYNSMRALMSMRALLRRSIRGWLIFDTTPLMVVVAFVADNVRILLCENFEGRSLRNNNRIGSAA